MFPEVKNVYSSLFAKGVSVKGKQDSRRLCKCFSEFGNDITAQLACSWNLAAGCEAVIEATFYGTKGGVALKNIQWFIL